jgi:hypothetical protein
VISCCHDLAGVLWVWLVWHGFAALVSGTPLLLHTCTFGFWAVAVVQKVPAVRCMRVLHHIVASLCRIACLIPEPCKREAACSGTSAASSSRVGAHTALHFILSDLCAVLCCL